MAGCFFCCGMLHHATLLCNIIGVSGTAIPNLPTRKITMNHTIALTDERNGHTTTIIATSDKHDNADDILFDAFTNGAWEDENGQQPANLTDMWNNHWAVAEIINTTAA